MAVKKCSIENCSSTLSRPEDIGVTYHKYPKDTRIRETWLSATRQTYNNIDNYTYVCSRHFCKSDFKVYQDSKYALKSDAVPSIFSWTPNIISNKMDPESTKESNSAEQTHNTSSSSKESEEENVDAIQKYIDKQEIDIQNKKNEDETQEKADMDEKQNSENPEFPERPETIEKINVIDQVENVVLRTRVMDMILSVSEDKADSKKDIKPTSKQSVSPKGNSIALSVGSKVVAKDFAELWYPAEIVEVDHDEMEVLVHYENVSNKHDEWINISSPRLRPITKPSTLTETPVLTPAIAEEAPPQDQVAPTEPVQEIKVEDKPKLHFVVGERCLARWRDNRRFIATIANDLSNGVYEVIFDDGFHWKCNTSRLYKLKDSGKHSEFLSVDTSMPPKPSTPSPVQAGAGPSTALPLNPITSTPIFHTHLFDPTRDYLGPKSERREMKRKLNIKEIFNIGQKKKKKDTPPKEKVARVVKEKKPRVLLRKIKEESVEEVKTEAKAEIPDAVASIIGTVAKEEAAKPTVPEIKMEPDTEQSLDKIEVNKEIKLEQSEVQEGSDKITLDDLVDNRSVASTEIEIPVDLDLPQPTLDMEPDLEEEVKLENFEKPDESKKEVIEKMKEVISKLEVGLIKIEDDHQNRVDSPKPEPKIELKTELKSELKSDLAPEPEIEVIEVNPAACEVDKVDKVEPQEKSKKKLSKIKKSKKLRLLQEKKVKKQVEKVKSELEEMKRQVEEMRKQMLLKTELSSPVARPSEMPESFLLPGEWCCKWRDGQPVGTVSEIEGDCKMDANNRVALPRRSVQVEDKRLPEGWSKHMVRRRLGQSAGKWDVVLVSPTNHRFHTKNDMRNYLELNRSEELKPYEYALLDFGVHLKLSRRMGWYTTTVDGSSDPVVNTPVNTMSPLAKAKKYRVYRKDDRKEKKKKRKNQIAAFRRKNASLVTTTAGTSGQASLGSTEFEATPMEYPALEDGYAGERIKIEHMRREEIINCHCGFREEDGLMVQCELCLCWQHALCHNIQKESEVPEKYTCSICLNPKRGRRSKRFLHDQDRLYEGLLPGAKPCESLRRSHELSGNLLRIQDALHALRVKYYVATKKDHPKLYLWAKDWENAEVNFTQERLNSDYSDLNIIINNIGKENLPIKHEDVHLDLRAPLTDDLDHDRFSQRDSSNSLLNLTAALSSPGGTLDLPITTSELERLAKSVQEQEVRNVSAPQPEAAIENGACRERLLRHVQRSQALIDARLDSIEAQVAELESQDPSFEDDETADYFPRTKQTIQMLMRDLDTMEELGIIT
ncbi:PHD finger protein 20-like protein 1 isoform X4 [Maniola hyperantus]|uniref:PHD finger protein 20-like protein 1 isoform X4 n=1 Tax=Aphantopus hyperantus TaxID=2795564 RepID=UPI00374A41C1